MQSEQSLAFLRAVLPSTGVYSLRSPRNKAKPHALNNVEYATTIDELWGKLQSHNDTNVFFSTASFKDNSSATADNVAALRALRLDLDKYPTTEDAFKAVLLFARDDAKLPAPIFVFSGRGLHVWWPLEQELTPQEWEPYALGLKNACAEHELLADPTVTADAARILRCPGTFNWKTGKPVEVKQDRRVPTKLFSLDQFAGLLSYAPTLSLAPAPPAAVPSTVCNDYTMTYYADMVAAIPQPEGYKNALDVGMALHSLGWGEPAFELWRGWYEGSPEAQSPSGSTRDQLAAKWETFSTDKTKGITAGSLDHWAKETGWTPSVPRPPATVINDATSVYKPLPSDDPNDPWVAHYQVVTKGDWIRTASNAIAPKDYQNVRRAVVLLGIRGRLNRFTSRRQVMLPWLSSAWIQLKDSTDHVVRNRICDEHKFTPGITDVSSSLIELCNEIGPFDPILEWLDGLTWDGVPRLDKWLHTYLEAEDTRANEAFGSVFLIAAVRRAKQPGCKFDHMLILEGEENAGKSRTVQILAGPTEYFSDQAILRARDKEQQELIEGIWFYEVAELAGIRRTESDLLKAFITRQEDRNRKAYGRHREEDPRRCVFIATTNEVQQEYLSDSAGLRRFWPVTVGTVDQTALKRDRDQLFAEAVIRERQTEYLSLPRDVIEEAEEVQTVRQASPTLVPFLDGITGERVRGIDLEWVERISVKDVLRVLRVEGKEITAQHYRSVASSMRWLGWAGPKQFRFRGQPNAQRYQGYERPCIEEASGLENEAIIEQLEVYGDELHAVASYTGL